MGQLLLFVLCACLFPSLNAISSYREYHDKPKRSSDLRGCRRAQQQHLLTWEYHVCGSQLLLTEVRLCIAPQTTALAHFKDLILFLTANGPFFLFTSIHFVERRRRKFQMEAAVLLNKIRRNNSSGGGGCYEVALCLRRFAQVRLASSARVAVSSLQTQRPRE